MVMMIVAVVVVAGSTILRGPSFTKQIFFLLAPIRLVMMVVMIMIMVVVMMVVIMMVMVMVVMTVVVGMTSLLIHMRPVSLNAMRV